MNKDNFWSLFHAAWGKSTDSPNYDKKAWMHVQAEVEKFFKTGTLPSLPSKASKDS